MCSTHQLVGPILKLEVKRQEFVCAPIEKDTCFENRQFHIAIVHPISLHMPQYYNITTGIPGPLFYQELIYLPCWWLSSGVLKNIIFGVKGATNDDFCQGTV